MILALAFILATPACIATGPRTFTCETVEECVGVMGYAEGVPQNQCDALGKPLKPLHAVLHRRPVPMSYGVKMNAPECPSNAHPHLRSMDTSVPDVKGAGLPKPDGKCHLDNKTDAVIGGG